MSRGSDSLGTPQGNRHDTPDLMRSTPVNISQRCYEQFRRPFKPVKWEKQPCDDCIVPNLTPTLNLPFLDACFIISCI